MSKILFFTFLVASWSGLFELRAQNQSAETLQVKKTFDFDITGSGDQENWDQTDWVQLSQRTNQDKTDGLSSRFKILYSDTGIYLLYYSEDEILNASIESDFEELWNEDVVEAFLWPDEEEKIYFEYELSPLNYELPILVSQHKDGNIHWIPFEYSYKEGRKAIHKTAIINGEKEYRSDISGWHGEIFIPFKLLRPLSNVPPTPGTEWKANFYRVDIDHGATYWSWKPFNETFHDLEQYGTIVFE